MKFGTELDSVKNHFGKNIEIDLKNVAIKLHYFSSNFKQLAYAT